MRFTDLKLTSSKGKAANVKYTNVIGRNAVASFFASNDWAIMTSDLQAILDMEPGDTKEYRFPNGTDWILVERS